MGDAHTAQGNSELDGTGIETSINGDFKITLHKADSLPKPLQNLTFPLLENSNEYVVHGLTYAVCHIHSHITSKGGALRLPFTPHELSECVCVCMCMCICVRVRGMRACA